MLFKFLLCIFCSIFSVSSQVVEDLNIVEEQHPITEIHLGNKSLEDSIIYVYISPSCLHCAQFIVEDLEKFLENVKNEKHVIIKFLPASAKDIFIIKLLNNETKSEDLFFLIFKNYIKRILATINKISPTDEQLDLFKGSKKDPEMIKFQVGAYEFGFSEEKIKKAYPKMKDKFEQSLTKDYSESVEELSHILESKEINLPLIVNKNKICKSIYDIKD